jgi:hypothetical protein
VIINEGSSAEFDLSAVIHILHYLYLVLGNNTIYYSHVSEPHLKNVLNVPTGIVS